MAKNKKFTPSQLKWLAESLTNSQMAYLLEDDAQLNQANQNAGVVAAPSNPGMQSTDSNGSMKPSVEQSNQNTQVGQKTISPQEQMQKLKKFVESNQNFDMKPEDGVKFLGQAGITMQVLANMIGFTAQEIAKLTNPQNNGDLSKVPTMTKNCGILVDILVYEKNRQGNAAANEALKCGVDVKNLGDNIKASNTFTVFNEGKKMCANNQMTEELDRLVKMNESLTKKYGDVIPSEATQMLKNVQYQINESVKKNSIEEMVNEYYNLTTKLKNLEKVFEKCNVKLVKYNNMKKVTAKANQKLNETVSALKFAINYYKENK